MADGLYATSGSELHAPLLRSNDSNTGEDQQSDSCRIAGPVEESLIARLPTPYTTDVAKLKYNIAKAEDLENFLYRAGDVRLLADHACLVDSTRQLGENHPATISQLQRTTSYLGLKQTGEELETTYLGDLGQLRNAKILVGSIAPADKQHAPKTCYTIVPTTPSRISDLLSAVIVLKRAISDFGTPIGRFNRIPIAPGYFGRTRTRRDVEATFLKNKWRVSWFKAPEGNVYLGAVRPGQAEDNPLIEIPSTERISHVTLRIGIVDRSLADLRYYKATIEQMFGKPS